MKEFFKWFFVLICVIVLLNAGFMYTMYTINSQIRSKIVGALPTPVPELKVKPVPLAVNDDPLMEDMELLTLHDLRNIPRHYLEMQLKGKEYWMHQKTGKVYTKNEKGKLVNAL